jgi:hypothetical protein
MLLTGRHAIELLREVVSSDDLARLLLRTGIAGAPVRSRASLLYEEGKVRALALRPLVDRERLWSMSPRGLFVARLPRTTQLDLTQPWRAVADCVVGCMRCQRQLPEMVSALISVRIRVEGPLPFAATFAGFVVLVADLVGLTSAGPVLSPPGPWAALVSGRRLVTPSGGRPGYVLAPPWPTDAVP